MAGALEELKREVKAVASAPIMAGSFAIFLIVLIWGLTHWSYRSVISSKDSYIASLERRIAEYRHNLNGASPEEARHRFEAMELELKALRIRLRPRRLTDAQRQALSDRSRRPHGTPSRSITLKIHEDCSDCAAFAAELAGALRLSENWTVGSQPLTQEEGRPPLGLGVRVAEPTRPSQEAVVLQQALRSADLPFNILPADANDQLELWVTERSPR